MPFENEVDTATREAATARVLQRRMTNPKDRNVLRVVAEEFGVREQSLREWVADAEPWGESAAPKKRRPRFSPVVRTTIAPRPVPHDSEQDADEGEGESDAVETPDTAPDEAAESRATDVDTPKPQDRAVDPEVVTGSRPAPAAAAPAAPAPATPAQEQSAPVSTVGVVALQAEADALRGDIDVLKAAIRVVLGD